MTATISTVRRFATLATGQVVASGVYLYRLETEDWN